MRARSMHPAATFWRAEQSLFTHEQAVERENFDEKPDAEAG